MVSTGGSNPLSLGSNPSGATNKAINMNARYAFELGYRINNGKLYLNKVPMNRIVIDDKYFYLTNNSKVYIKDLIKYQLWQTSVSR